MFLDLKRFAVNVSSGLTVSELGVGHVEHTSTLVSRWCISVHRHNCPSGEPDVFSPVWDLVPLRASCEHHAKLKFIHSYISFSRMKTDFASSGSGSLRWSPATFYTRGTNYTSYTVIPYIIGLMMAKVCLLAANHDTQAIFSLVQVPSYRMGVGIHFRFTPDQ